jgi:hypothetical protein
MTKGTKRLNGNPSRKPAGAEFWHVWTVWMPRRSIGRKHGRRQHNGRRWIYKRLNPGLHEYALTNATLKRRQAPAKRDDVSQSWHGSVERSEPDNSWDARDEVVYCAKAQAHRLW